MNGEYYSLSSSQYIARGDPESVRNALIEILQRNSIPFLQGNKVTRPFGIESVSVLQLYAPRWFGVGQIELDPVDHSQTLVRFCLPTFPDEKETESLEQEIRETLPPSAVAVRLMDADGQRERALAYLGGYLHEFRIHRLCEIQFLLAKTLGLLSLHGLTIEKHRHPESAISPPESQKQTNEKVDRDIPTENEPIRGDLQELLRLWQLGYTAKEIASRIGRTEKTILNRLTLLRKAYGEQIVPRRRTI